MVFCYGCSRKLETPFKDSDQPVSIDSKHREINDFNELKTNKKSSNYKAYL